MNKCIYCNLQENNEPGNIYGWFSANTDSDKVCPDCEAKYGLEETKIEQTFATKQIMSALGKKSWQARKGQDMKALANKRWHKPKSD